MRRLRSVVAVLLMAGLVNAASPAPACAVCSCAVITQAQAFDHADLVFVGVIVGEDRSQVGNSSDDPVLLTFQVRSVEKGSAGSTVVVRTGRDSASCGWGYSIKRWTRVYVRNGQTGLCSGNSDLGDAGDVPVDTRPVAAPHKTFPIGWVIGGATIVFFAGGFFVWRRRQDSA